MAPCVRIGCDRVAILHGCHDMPRPDACDVVCPGVKTRDGSVRARRRNHARSTAVSCQCLTAVAARERRALQPATASGCAQNGSAQYSIWTSLPCLTMIWCGEIGADASVASTLPGPFGLARVDIDQTAASAARATIPVTRSEERRVGQGG